MIVQVMERMEKNLLNFTFCKSATLSTKPEQKHLSQTTMLLDASMNTLCDFIGVKRSITLK